MNNVNDINVMVSSGTIISCVVTLLLTLVLPVAVLIVYGVKNNKKGVWSAWFLGAAGFFVMQIIIRIPIISILTTLDSTKDFIKNNYVLYALILGFTAALSELIGRFAVAKIMSKKLTPERSIAAGLGHGGIEAIIVVGLTYINNLIYIFMINAGSFDNIIEMTRSTGADVSQLIQLKDTLIGTSSVLFLLAGYERILTMLLHLALTLIVCYGVKHKKTVQTLLICLGVHTFVDTFSAIMSGLSSSYLGNVLSTTASTAITYIVLTIIAIASVIVVIKLTKRWKQNQQL